MSPELLDAFASSPLLRGLGPSELESLASHCEIVTFETGAVLLSQGQLNDRLLVLVDGTADLVRELGTHEETIARLSRGALLGEMSTLSGRPVALTIRATSPVRAASLDKETALRLLETTPRLGSNLAMILIDHLQGHLGRRVARTSLLVLDDDAGEAQIEAARAFVGAVGRYARRTITADLTDRLRLVRARGLPTLTELAADPRHGAAITREVLNSTGMAWTLRLGADQVDAPRVLRALHLLDQQCDQLMVVVHARDAQALLEDAKGYFWRGVWLTSDGAKPPPFAFTNAAVEAERGRRTRILLTAGERPMKIGAMRALDTRVGGKAFVSGGSTTDVRGTHALARDLAGQRVGLALGAGASRGFAHIGVLERLKSLGLPIDVIVGCSAGSGIGASWSFGFEPDHLAHAFGELQKHAARWTLPSRSLMSGRALGQHIANVAAGCGFDDALWPIGVVAVDLYAAREELFTEGSIVDCIRASSAIPGIYPPVKIGEKWYVDGGVLNPLPSAFVRPVGADIVIAVDLAGGTPPELAAKAPLRGPSLLQVLRQSANLMHARITHHAREAADLIIRPMSEGPAPSVTDYVGAQIWRRYGREAVERTLPELEALLPWFRAPR